MKHTQTFESFLNEDKDEIIFSVDDDKLDQLLNARFSRQLDYEDVKGDSYYSLPKREFDQFIDLADSSGFDVDYENSEDSVVYVYESEKLVFDELGTEIEALRTKISNLMKETTDKKWATALGQALTALSGLDKNLSNADAKLGVVPIK